MSWSSDAASVPWAPQAGRADIRPRGGVGAWTAVVAGQASRWHPVAYLFPGQLDQLAAAGHAATLPQGQVQLAEDVDQLGLDGQTAGHEQRRDHAVADQGELEHVAVGAEHRAALG